MAAGAGALSRSFASQEAIRIALAATGVVVWEWTFGEDAVQWGEGLELVYGRPREDVTFEVWRSIVHDEDRDRIIHLISTAAEARSSYEGEFRVIWPEGSVHWVLVRGHVYESPDGTPPRLAGMLMNVTARKQEEAKRRDREERQQAALKASRTGTFRWEMRTNDLEWDDELNGLFGLRNGQTARSLDQFLARVHPEDLAGVMARCERCVRTGEDFEMEYRVLWPDGSVHWLYDRGKAYHDEDGEPMYMTGACVDATERRSAAEALRHSERDLRLIIDAMPALVGYVDKDLIYRRVNRTYEDWFKIPAEKIVGMHVRELAGDAQYEKTIPYRSRVLKGEHVSFETEFTGPDGQPRWLEANFIPCLDAESSVCGFFALTLDITRRKRAEATMRKQEKLALVGRLASSIAHEINNPLEAVTNLLYLGEIAQETEKVRSYLNAAQQELSRVSQIATLALQFHRPQSEPKLVNICTLLDSVLPLFESRLRNARIEVEKQYRPTRLIPAMEGELRQVFANIISNACDALTLQSQRAKSRIVLRVRDHKDASGELRVHVTIADDGIGMSSETRRRLFEPFFSTKEDKGTGLGLWISSEIVSKHRGKIRVKSRLGVGTMFRIELPFGIL